MRAPSGQTHGGHPGDFLPSLFGYWDLPSVVLRSAPALEIRPLEIQPLHTQSFRSLMPGALALTATLVLGACGGAPNGNGAEEAASANGEYAAERSTVDGIETVRTVSGSRWGGDGRLVEEVSIGEDIGDEAYLFGQITAAWATEDRIYVVDSQGPAVRAFDHEGNYLFDIGSPGQGPGEFGQPLGIAVADDGRIMVSDLQGGRLNVFDAEGSPLDDWSLGSPQAAMGLEMTYDGELFTRMIELPDRNQMTSGTFEIRTGMQAAGPDGLQGDPVFPPPSDYERPTTTVEMGGNRMQMAILPFTPSYEWVLTPGGDMVVGVGNEYRFEIHAPDGRVTAVEKYWDPVPVDPDELYFRTEMAANNFRAMSPDFSIPESEVPDYKPAFTRFRADRSRRVWVIRQGPSRPDPDCTEMGGGGGGVSIMMSFGDGGGGGNVRIRSGGGGGGPENDYDAECWANTYKFDVFELATGEFLGTVPAPEVGFNIPLFVAGDTVLAAVTDGMGITRLKKYRLVTG